MLYFPDSEDLPCDVEPPDDYSERYIVAWLAFVQFQ